jgi:hypothetical protein
MEVVAFISLVCFYASSQKCVASSLEQRINIKCCMKLGKDASDISEIISEAYRGGGSHEKSHISEWHIPFKESLHVEIAHEDNSRHFLRYQMYCSL